MITRYKLVCFVLITYIAVFHTTSTNAFNTDNRSFILNNVSVVDVQAGKILKHQNVCVVDGIITQVSKSHCQRKDLTAIDGQGGYLTPGLIDMHVHTFEKEGLMFTLSHGVTHVRLMNGVSAQLKWRDDAEAGETLSSTATVSSPIISGYEGAVLHHGLSSAEDARKAVGKYHEQGYDVIKAYSNLNPQAFSALMERSRELAELLHLGINSHRTYLCV